MRLYLALFLSVTGVPPLLAAVRTLTPDDVYNIKEVSEPHISPDGHFVAYTVSSLDRTEDERFTDVYQVPTGGGEAVRLTASPKPSTSPRFSPDGHYLAFLSAREGKKTQVWLLNRSGGDPVRLTDYKASVSALDWSPDSQRLALEVMDVDPEDEDSDTPEEALHHPKPPHPIVIQRRQFMRDGEGYLRHLRKHIYVFDVREKTSAQITTGPYDDFEPAWTPDGRSIVFTSNRTPDPDSNQNTDIFVVAARPGEKLRPLTIGPEPDASPAVSPSGDLVAFVAGGDPKDLWYGTSHIGVVALTGDSAPRILTASLDRNATNPRFSPDGKWVYFSLEEEGNGHVARVPVLGGPIERVVTGERDVQAFELSGAGELVALSSEPDLPPELFVLGKEGLKRLTSTNDTFLKGIRLGRVERFRARSADGTMIDGFLTRPPDAPTGTRLPTILRIHGGPVEQFSTLFQLQWQILAAQGFAVVAGNPRGSSGYGQAFSRAIWADWGHKDYEDIMAVVDRVIETGVADPDRLGVGGWSYGGILTDYVITKSTRFKAAVSGASEANYLADYGTDHYQYEWETELGLPWRNVDRWVHLSPWFAVENVRTPTLILCGSSDMNVPLLNSEQLYQALKRLGVETELIIYPGATHSIQRPSYQKDRLERYIAWYLNHLKPAGASAATARSRP